MRGVETVVSGVETVVTVPGNVVTVLGKVETPGTVMDKVQHLKSHNCQWWWW